MLDPPGEIEGDTSIGKEFYTCVDGFKKDVKGNFTGTVLAALNWGYYVDKDKNVIFSPKPNATRGCPKEVKDAILRWDGLGKTTKTEIPFGK